MFSSPRKNLKAFGLREDDVVVDLGAGTGHYVVHAGELAHKGKVYAVEIERDFLDLMRGKVRDSGLRNVEIIWGNIEKLGGTKIGDEVADSIIASNVLFQLEDKEQFIKEIARILKPNGRVLLVDWVESPLVHEGLLVHKDKARNLFETASFKVDRELDAGEHHYGMIFRKV